MPIHAEAHALPFADGFFDAVVSVDAYHYFGTDQLYLSTRWHRCCGPAGRIGIVVPGLVEEFDDRAGAPGGVVGSGAVELPRAGLVARDCGSAPARSRWRSPT